MTNYLNSNTNSGIVIIGSGLAGYTLAREFRKLNQQIPLHIITADDGSFYSKPQLTSALGHNKSAEQLATISAEKAAIQFQATIDTHTVVTSIDTVSQTVICNQKIIPYQSLVFACGAKPILPALSGDAVDDVHSVNDLQDYIEFRRTLEGKKHVAIIGSGLVGCEFSNDLINANYQVSVVGSSPTPLDRLLPRELGTIFQQGLAAKGVNWYLAQKVIAVDHSQKRYRLSFNDGKYIEADLVIRAIGLRPHISLAQNAGITCNRGIFVNQYLQTNFTNIYAIGDCAEVEGLVLLYLAPLVLAARALAKSLSGTPTAVHYPAMPIFVKTPACPVVVALPATGREGNWSFNIEEKQGTGLLYDSNQKLCGFALVGAATAQSSTLGKQIPPLLD